IAFTDSERDLMLDDLGELREAYAQMRAVPLPNDVAPAFVFDPRVPGGPTGPMLSTVAAPEAGAPPTRPQDLDDLAFASVGELGALLRARQISAVELAELYLARLRRYDPLLHCVITLTEDRALAQARQADADLAAGRDHGPLHGIPWGAKDLLATRGIRTTWG